MMPCRNGGHHLTYPGNTNGANIRPVCRCGVCTPKGPGQDGTYPLHQDTPVHRMARRRGHVTHGGAGIVVTDGIQNGDERCNDETKEDDDGERWSSVHACQELSLNDVLMELTYNTFRIL